MRSNLGARKTKFRLFLFLVSLFLSGCFNNDEFFESKATETTYVEGKEVFNPKDGLQKTYYIDDRFHNEYENAKAYPAGTSRFSGEMDKIGTIQGIDRYEDGTVKKGTVMPGKRLWHVEPEGREE